MDGIRLELLHGPQDGQKRKDGINMNIIVGISWPFANGDLHIGHAASSLPGDVIARFHRLKGNNVILVSGSDCHGTPIDVKALQEKKTAKGINHHWRRRQGYTKYPPKPREAKALIIPKNIANPFFCSFIFLL